VSSGKPSRSKWSTGSVFKKQEINQAIEIVFLHCNNDSCVNVQQESEKADDSFNPAFVAIFF